MCDGDHRQAARFALTRPRIVADRGSVHLSFVWEGRDRRAMIMQRKLWMSAIALVLASGAAVAQMEVVALMPNQVKWARAWLASGLEDRGPDGRSHNGGPLCPASYAAAKRHDPGAHASRQREHHGAFRCIWHRRAARSLIGPRDGCFRQDRSTICRQIWPTLLGRARKARSSRIHGVGPSGMKMIH